MAYLVPYIIILNNKRVIYDSADNEIYDVTIIDKIVNMMYNIYDNELSSYDDFIYRQTKLPNILNTINNSQYLSINSELNMYQNFIAKNFSNNNDAVEVLYFDNNKWNKYDIPQRLVYNLYKIKFLQRDYFK